MAGPRAVAVRVCVLWLPTDAACGSLHKHSGCSWAFGASQVRTGSGAGSCKFRNVRQGLWCESGTHAAPRTSASWPAEA
eukprot:3618499-Rhodomonas_salina.2